MGRDSWEGGYLSEKQGCGYGDILLSNTTRKIISTDCRQEMKDRRVNGGRGERKISDVASLCTFMTEGEYIYLWRSRGNEQSMTIGVLSFPL